jgi:hypothetical protein
MPQQRISGRVFACAVKTFSTLSDVRAFDDLMPSPECISARKGYLPDPRFHVMARVS